MMCHERQHQDCRRFSGPFFVVDVDTGRQLRPYGFHDLARAFMWADQAVKLSHNTRDYVIRNNRGQIVRRSVYANA